MKTALISKLKHGLERIARAFKKESHMATANLLPGDVFKVRSGLKYLNTQSAAVEISRDILIGIVETTRTALVGSEDDHFEPCYMVDFRWLGADGSYDPAAPLNTFAQSGDFRPEYIEDSPVVIERRSRTYVK